MEKTLFQKQNISEELVDYLKWLILSGELKPGDRIVETKLAKDLGISQTPVREALRQLQGEGIIQIIPNRGPMVRSFDMRDVYEIYSIRSVLEGLAIRLAAQRAGDDEIAELEQFYYRMKDKVEDDAVPVSYLLSDSFHIHDTIVKMSGHSRLNNMYKSITFQIALINQVLGSASSKKKEFEQHWELIEALKSRNPDKAEEVMRRHIYNSYREFVELRSRQGDGSEFNELVWFNQ